MSRVFRIFLILVLVATSLYAQDSPASDRQNFNGLSKSSGNIHKLTAKTGVVYKIQTAVGFVTTIELPDEALKVFAGDQDSFVVEVYGSEVIIKPATDYLNARSNLTIYTEKTRLTFDLSVGAPETADFVLDFRYPRDEALVDNLFRKRLDEKKAELEAFYQEKLKKEDERVRVLADGRFEEDLKKEVKIKRLNISGTQNNVRLDLLSLSKIGERYYLRFSITNYSQGDYAPERVVLGKEIFKRNGFGLTKDGFVPVEFSENIDKTIPKGAKGFGLVSFDKVTLNTNEKLVLRLYETGKTDPIEISQVPLEV